MFSPFRFLGDILHVASIFLLLNQIVRTQSCHGMLGDPFPVVFFVEGF
jgi:hypothetical protein